MGSMAYPYPEDPYAVEDAPYADYFSRPNRPDPRTVNQRDIEYIQTDDPKKMSRYDRNWAVQLGAEMDQGLQNRIADQDYWNEYWRNANMTQYDPILAGQGGYRPNEQNQIIREQELQNLQWRPEMAQNLYLNDAEREAVMGDPYGALNSLDPGRLTEIGDRTGDQMRAVVGGYAQNVRGTVDPATMRMRDEAYGQLSKGMDLSQDFIDSYRMSPEQQRRMVDQAARTVGTGYQAAIDNLEQRAAAQGNTSPLAINAARRRLEAQSALDQANAMTDARLMTDNERAKREYEIESMRLGQGDRNRSGLLAAEQLRLGSEGDLAGLRSQQETKLGDVALGVEQDIGGLKSDIERYNQDMRYRGKLAGDEAASSRGQWLGSNRQGAYGQELDQQWGRGTGINDRLSGRNIGVADARRDDEKEARGWLTGQQQQANENVNTGWNQRLQNFGTQGTNMNRATGMSQDYDMARRTTGFGASFKNAFGSGLGGGLAKGVSAGLFG
jgi:hypothetical protein